MSWVWLGFSRFVCLFDSMRRVGQVGWFCCWLFEINWVLFEFLGFWVFECLRFLGFLWFYDFGYESLGKNEKNWWIFSMGLCCLLKFYCIIDLILSGNGSWFNGFNFEFVFLGLIFWVCVLVFIGIWFYFF